MSHLIKLTLLIMSSICFCNCNSSKKSVDSQTGLYSEESYIQDGYVKAVIKDNKSDSPCGSVLISIVDSKDILDPVNLENIIGKWGKNIWLKYNSLRMQNRCEVARPINVIAIKKRDE
ncbi:hypothetical protein BTO06_01700 [Tenacibaculum sp. SZ-18]|nr:hypothetical protein BTO06_01700 [Tenacibaculum sp. SZ-18]